MKQVQLTFLILFFGLSTIAQNVMTPELLWQLGRVNGSGISKDGKSVVYTVRKYDMDSNNSASQAFVIPIGGGTSTKITNPETYLINDKISSLGNHKLFDRTVKMERIFGSDFYPELKKTETQIYDNLMFRHWDTWADGSYSHIFVSDRTGQNEVDIMAGLPYHCPTRPFGGSEDYIWSPDGMNVLYVTKTKTGKDYAVSTNTDIFSYNLSTQRTINLTEGMMGYDNSPAYSSSGVLAWLSMKRDGYESDKNDIYVMVGNTKINLTANWDGTVDGFTWGSEGKFIYFTAPVNGTKHLFKVNFPGMSMAKVEITQITNGQFDVTGIVGQSGKTMVVSRTDMNHATELYTVDLATGKMTQLTHVNDDIYAKIQLSKIEKWSVTTTDNKQMVTWVIYPPNFDPAKKYPTLLYCQGGPQGALSQFYSFRWNFQVMAAQGYIVVAPNRRGMPGHGVAWNEQISKDYGGQNMRDYLSAIDEAAKKPYVDKNRIGAVGASYGGYSVFYLAGIHNNRFKTFISHDGIYNWQSMYGTTEEVFFPNWDLGGAYWNKSDTTTQKAYNQFNPINYIDKWNTPIMIVQGGLDYRVPIGQGLEAFQAAQLRGVKSRILYLPNENHWVSSAQNGLVWQREFFRWLAETL